MDQTITFAGPDDQLTTSTPPLSATSSSGLPVSFAVTSGPASWNGSQLVFSGAGLVTVTASQAGNANYNAAPDVVRSFTVSKAPATVTISDLLHTFDGTEKPVTTTTTPSGLTVDLTYASSATAPTDAGSYEVIATIDDAMYQGSDTQNLIIEKANQAITFAALPDRFTTETPTLEATSDSGLPVTLAVTSGPATLTGDELSFSTSGTVTITASQAGNGNYNPGPDVVRSFTVTKAPATVTISDLLHTFDGAPKPVTTATSPSGLAVDVTYAGSPTAPTSAGTYEVVAAINDLIYQGSATQTLVIEKANQAISFAALPDRFTTETPTLVATSSSGLPVNFAVTSGPAILTGDELNFSTSGTVTITASQPGNTNYHAAPDVVRSFTVSKTPATVSLSDLLQSYDLLPKPVSITTTPPGLAVNVEYAGLTTAPTYAGTYSVVATIDDEIYAGSDTRNLVIEESYINGSDCLPKNDTFITGPDLQPFWRFLNPVGDGEAKLTGTTVSLSVPGGGSHDLWSGSQNLAPRLLQATDDGDFALEVTFVTMPTEKFQMQGLIVQQDDDTFLRFGVYHDGNSLRIFSALIDDDPLHGESATVYHSGVPAEGVIPYVLRVERIADTWTYRYSEDGVHQTTAVSFDKELEVTESGFYAGNHTPNPPYTAKVESFLRLGCQSLDFPGWMKPDFAMTSVTLDPTPTIPNQPFSAIVTVKNSGALAADVGVLRTELTKVGGTTPAGVDPELNGEALAVGESKTFTITGLTAPAVAGTYNLYIRADADNLVDELSEGNNHTIATYTTVALPEDTGPAPWEKPDFTVTAFTLSPVPSVPDENFSSTVTVKNAGVFSGDAGIVRVMPYPGATSVDVAVGTLEVGESKSFEIPGLMTPSTAGTYTATATVDADLDTDELSEGNNVLMATYTTFDSTPSSPGSTWERPDFAVTDIRFIGNVPTTTGQPYTVRVKIANRGQVGGDAGNLYLFASKAGHASPGDEIAADSAVAIGHLDASGPGSSKTVDVTLVSPPTRGVHHTRAFLVSPEVEWSTGDNQMSATSWIKMVNLSMSFSGGDVELSWNNYWGDTYTIFRKVGTGDFFPIATELPSARPELFNTFTDENPPSGGVLLYRVEINP